MIKKLLYLVAFSTVFIEAFWDSEYYSGSDSDSVEGCSVLNGLDKCSTTEITNLVNKQCRMIISSAHKGVTISADKMDLIFMSGDHSFRFAFSESDKLWNLELFRKNSRVVIFCTGWMTTPHNSTEVKAMWNAFKTRPEINFVIVDVAIHMNTFYLWSAVKAKPIGEHLAKVLRRLFEIRRKHLIYLVGHSLGAHIMGSAGKAFDKTTGHLLTRITGLDPAKPCFCGENALSGLRTSNAKLVDVIHSNVDVLGIIHPIGHLDFYPAGLNPIQPGCTNSVCSHTRSIDYFAESVYSNKGYSFVAYKCHHWKNLRKEHCDKHDTAVMGYSIDKNLKGIFFVEVKTKSPYGKKMKNVEDYDSN